jgi:hypothetical protein
MIIAALRRAPEAYEDEEGLRIIRDDPFRPVHSHSDRIFTKNPAWHGRHETILKHLLHSRKTTGQGETGFLGKLKKKHLFHQPIPGFVAK